MYILLMGILGLLLIASIGDFSEMLSVVSVMVVVTLIKLSVMIQDLQRKYLRLESRFEHYVQEQLAKEQVKDVTKKAEVEAVEKSIDQELKSVQEEAYPAPIVDSGVQIEPHKENRAAQVEEDSQFISHKTSNVLLRQRADKKYDALVRDLIEKIKTYFTTGNPMVKVGGVILFFGLTFLIRFAVSNEMISIETSLLSVLLFAIALTVVGWRFKTRQGDFGLILQGIGIAIFYLAIFAGAKFFSVIPLSMALAAMVLTVIFATTLAVLQNTFYLAIFSTVGGFLAPILTSTGEGSHIVLFSYYAFLNLSIIGIAWFKAWRLLNLIGFGFTFVIGTIWGVSSYSSENFATTEPFLILFSLMYIGVAILFAHRKPFALKAYVDASLVFGVPTVGFGLQAALVQEFEYGLAFSALVTSALYLSLAWGLRKKEQFSLLSESFLALGVVFLSLVFAFAFSPEVSSVVFALEASAIIWISFRQERVYSRIFALFLELYALGSFFNHVKYMHSALFLNSVYLGFAILAISLLISSYIYYYYRSQTKEFEKSSSVVLLVLSLLVWFGSGFQEVKESEHAYFMIYFSLSTLGLMALSIRLRWDELTKALELYMPLGLLGIAVVLFQENHPFVKYYSIAIPLYFAVYYLLLYRLKLVRDAYWHVAGLWAMLLLLSLELMYHLKPYSETIAISSFALLPVLAIYLILSGAKFWPLRQKRAYYSHVGIMGIGVALMLWELKVSLLSAALQDMIYIPLLNPLELMQITVVVTLVLWKRRTGVEKQIETAFIAFWTMAFATLFLARSIHYYGDVSYTLKALNASDLFQTSLSIMYTLMALAVIVYAKRERSRLIWISGALLLGLVIIKLLLVDMARSGSLERIISFLVVGLLILLVGSIAPLPPKKEEKSV